MRASRRFEGHIWLKLMPGDDPPGTVCIAGSGAEALRQATDTLIGQMGMYLLYQQEVDGVYSLHVYPSKPGQHGGHMPAGWYRGRWLSKLPVAALADMRHWAISTGGVVLARTEQVRWVE